MKTEVTLLGLVLATCMLIFNDKGQASEELNKDEFIYGEFPSYFKWGVGTSSYQIEGAWKKNGKGENIWDNFTHQRNPSPITDGSDGDIACDSYHKYKTDVQLVKSLGVDFYRFSISWARILPSGTTKVINQDGLDYYNNLIEELIKTGITPMIMGDTWNLA